MDLGPRIIILFDNGVYITETVFWAVIVAVILIIFAFVSTRKLERDPKGIQAVAELIVEMVYKFVKDTMGKHNLKFAPYIGTLFIFLILCNALGLLGQRAATADMNFTFAMGLLVFFLIQYNSIKSKGICGYMKHFTGPAGIPPLMKIFMVPINIIEELVFPVSLSFRIFGNILAGVIVVELWFHFMSFVSTKIFPEALSAMGLYPFQFVTGLLPQAFFDIFEPFLQAFVFSMLTMSFIARAIVIHSPDDGEQQKAEKTQ